MALPRRHRLSKKKDISDVFQRGRTLGAGFLYFRFLENDLNYSRIAVIVRSKEIKSAVRRNSIKRKVASAIAIDILKKASFDIAIVVTKSILEKGFKEIKRVLDEGIKEIIVKKNKNLLKQKN